MMTNIGMNQSYMSNLPRYGTPSQVYSPLQTVSGLRAGAGQQEPSDTQQALGALSMVNSANSAINGLTGFNPAASVKEYISDALSNPVDKAALLQDFGFPEDAGSIATNLTSNTPDVSSFGDWVANTPGNEAVDYLGSLGSEGLGQGMDLASVGSSAADFVSGLGSVLSMAQGLSNGWGWDDTGRALGTYFGGPIGGFIGGTIGNTVGNAVEGIGGALSDVGNSVGDALSGIGDAVGGIFGGGCFLTTACMYRHGDNFADDGRELTALRDLRDSYIRNLPEGSEVISAYYDKAPKQVELLVSRPDNKEVFRKMYHEYITPAVEQVESGDYESAYKTYLKLIDWVNNETQENDNG